MRDKRLIGSIIMTLFGLFLGGTTTSTIVNAANTNLTNAIKNAPQGINMSNRFKMPVMNLDGVAYTNPVSSKVLEDPNGNGTSIVQIVDGDSEAGGIWGDPDQNNYIDTTQAQTLSMWINMTKVGNGTASAGNPMGDGLAFVLQNDARGTNAISSYQDSINTGETLGVWGVDAYRKDSTPANLIKTAVQNSWALEFDTYTNSDSNRSYSNVLNTASSFYDAGLGQYYLPTNVNVPLNYPHIASGFPAQASTYKANRVTSSGKSAYYYTMNHDQPGDLDNVFTSKLLQSQKWLHLTVKVDYPNKTISYTFNDKNTDGTANTTNVLKDTVPFTDQFGLINNDKLLYGFTGSTGSVSMNGLVIFEQIPGFLQSSATAKIYDVDQNNKELISSKDYAYSGEKLALKYSLNYLNGNETWNGIDAKINLPNNIDYTADAAGNVGVITVGDKSEKIPATDITTTNGVTTLNHQLLESLNSDIPLATITINGTAKAVAQDTTVAATHARFIGQNSIADTDTPVFTIKNPTLKLTTSTANPLKLTSGEDANIMGNVSYTNNQVLTNSNMTVHTILNNGTEHTFKMNNSDPVGQFTFNIPQADLQPDNTALIYVTDGSGNESNRITFDIIVSGGTLSLTSSKTVGFKAVNSYTSAGQIIGRFGTWKLQVNDSRDNKPWKLTAKASPLTIEGTNQTFNGTMIFKRGFDTQVMTQKFAQIATSNDTAANSPITWTNDSGVLLKADGNNSAGKYEGKIEWDLSDSI